MHNNLIKVILLLSTVTLMSANTWGSQKIMHAAMLPNTNTANSLTRNLALAEETTQSINFISGAYIESQSESGRIFTTTQPLGSLVAITWTDLNISEKQPAFSKLLILPTEDDLGVQVQPTIVASAVSDDDLQNYAVPFDTSLLFTLLLHETHPKAGISCSGCHTAPNIGDVITITHITDETIHQLGDGTSIIECQACHMNNSLKTFGHIRGVE